MRQLDLNQEEITFLRQLAGRMADGYEADILIPALTAALSIESRERGDIHAALLDPFRCLRAIYSHYAFARRGSDRTDLSHAAVQALRRTLDGRPIQELLQEDNGAKLWDMFCQICEDRKIRNAEQLNRGVIAGMVELAQEIYHLDGIGSIASWVASAVNRTRRLEVAFLRIVDIRGVGPKAASTLLRDLVFLFGIEDILDHSEQIYVQPIDRWVRLAALWAIPELDGSGSADWIIAGKFPKCARRSGVSGIRANMGAMYFGARVVHDPACFDREAANMVSNALNFQTQS